MYLGHYDLSKFPFQLKPDPAFLYLGKAHARAKAYMDYTVWNRDGFVVITGEIGSGKTTLVQDLLSRLDERVVVAKIHQTQLDEVEFLQALLANFGIEAFDANKARLLALLNRFLQGQHAKGRQVLLVVDEAQYLNRKVLEEIRLLAGIDIGGEQVFNFILVGHPELIKTLDTSELEQLAQRVRLRFHLTGLGEDEVGEYIAHRLSVAGMPEQKVFSPEALPLICEYTGGVPRLINVLCDTAMMAAYVEETYIVTPGLVAQAIEELQWVPYADRARSGGHRVVEQALREQGQMPRLVLTKKGVALDEFPLDKEQIAIGRHPGNDIVLDERVISGHHAVISRVNGGHILRDLDSTNGTSVNAKRIGSHALKHGERIGITLYQLVYLNERQRASDSHEEATKIFQMPVKA
jgi:type II secretory pathway predicted ATPase ExeA